MRKGVITTNVLLFALMLLVIALLLLSWQYVLELQVKDSNLIKSNFNAERLAVAVSSLGDIEEDFYLEVFLPKNECELKFYEKELEFTIEGETSKVKMLNSISNAPITIECESDIEKLIEIKKGAGGIKVCDGAC